MDVKMLAADVNPPTVTVHTYLCGNETWMGNGHRSCRKKVEALPNPLMNPLSPLHPTDAHTHAHTHTHTRTTATTKANPHTGNRTDNSNTGTTNESTHPDPTPATVVHRIWVCATEMVHTAWKLRPVLPPE